MCETISMSSCIWHKWWYVNWFSPHFREHNSHIVGWLITVFQNNTVHSRHYHYIHSRHKRTHCTHMNDAGKTIFMNLNKTDVTKLQHYHMQQFIILHGTTTMTRNPYKVSKPETPGNLTVSYLTLKTSNIFLRVVSTWSRYGWYGVNSLSSGRVFIFRRGWRSKAQTILRPRWCRSAFWGSPGRRHFVSEKYEQNLILECTSLATVNR